MKLLLNLIILLFLANCSASYKELTNNKYSSNISFNQTLIEEYKSYADYEAKEMHDWNSAKLYSEKAIDAYKGKNIKPEVISNWKIKKEKLPELKNAYESLMRFYKKGLKEDPKNLAVAIAALDCWAEQQEENWQLDHIRDCKEKFYNSLNEIEINVSKKILENLDGAVVVSMENNILENIIYFNFDSYIISSTDINNLKKYLKNIQNHEFLIVGHTDTKGTNEYNNILSLKRAESIKSLMISLGINSKNIRIIAKGENELAVYTPDETANASNRRVEILPIN